MEKTRTCSVCGVELTPENSKGQHATMCNDCRKARQKEIMAQARAKRHPKPDEDELDPEDAGLLQAVPLEPVESPAPLQEDYSLAVYTDLELKEELERRGWEVTATKVITVTL